MADATLAVPSFLAECVREVSLCYMVTRRIRGKARWAEAQGSGARGTRSQPQVCRWAVRSWAGRRTSGCEPQGWALLTEQHDVPAWCSGHLTASDKMDPPRAAKIYLSRICYGNDNTCKSNEIVIIYHWAQCLPHSNYCMYSSFSTQRF